MSKDERSKHESVSYEQAESSTTSDATSVLLPPSPPPSSVFFLLAIVKADSFTLSASSLLRYHLFLGSGANDTLPEIKSWCLAVVLVVRGKYEFGVRVWMEEGQLRVTPTEEGWLWWR